MMNRSICRAEIYDGLMLLEIQAGECATAFIDSLKSKNIEPPRWLSAHAVTEPPHCRSCTKNVSQINYTYVIYLILSSPLIIDGRLRVTESIISSFTLNIGASTCMIHTVVGIQ